ncbi:MAG: esterase-like activity of phytase family protein [Proteobacteria bacterium]|nr:esterase-like activity of phytase family protein [Pseudomonadota bacterium]
MRVRVVVIGGVLAALGVIATIITLKTGRAAPGFDPTRAAGVFDAIALDARTPPGLSALALDDHQIAWTIPERVRVLVELRVPASPVTVIGTTEYPLDGIPDGVDTESLAWLAPGKFAIGLEGQDVPRAAVAFAERRGERFVVTSIRELDLGMEMQKKMQKNHGAEGLCGTADDLLVAIEEPGALPDGGRYAPLVRITHTPDGDRQTIYKLQLGSATGKISSLDCTTVGDILAIERHYGVSRIVRFTVPPAPTDAPLVETLVTDLAPILRDSLNLEGIAQLPDGRMLVVADNQGADVSGPDYVLVFPPR